MCNFWQTSWNFAPPGGSWPAQPHECSRIKRQRRGWNPRCGGSWEARKYSTTFFTSHSPQRGQPSLMMTFLSPKVLHKARKNEKSPHTITDAQLAKSIQVPNVNKSKPLVWLLAFNSVCKFCPGEAGGEAVRKSPQLFTFFLPAPPREAAPAANGAQQRLDSLVRIRDPRAARPLTHLRTVSTNTAVLFCWTQTIFGASPAAQWRFEGGSRRV